MKTAATIARANHSNNQRAERRTTVYAATAYMTTLLSSVLAWALFGCATEAPTTIEIHPWELAQGERIKPIILGQARVSFDRPLPSHLVQELSPEFSLITIARPADWAEVRRRLGLRALPPGVDLSRGMIVGLLADVGQPTQGDWPIRLSQVRTVAGIGWIDASFAAGLYYPLKTAGFVQLAYVPHLRAVSTVQINHRTFVIRPPSPAY